jgi:hypothetical protein
MLYDCEIWRLIERSKKALETMEMDVIQRSMKIHEERRAGTKKSNNGLE